MAEIVTGSFGSYTETRSSVTKSKVRTFKHDPQKYLKSEPIFIYDRREHLRLVLTDDGIPYRDGWMTEQLNGELKLEFTVLANDPAVKYIENEGRAVVRNIDGQYMEFIIRSIEDTDEDGTYKHVFAEGGEYELIDEFLPGYKNASVDLKTALTTVLQGTRWKVGMIDDPYFQKPVDLKNGTKKEAVVNLITQFGGEVRYRVEIKGNKITDRYIDVFKKRGAPNMKRLEAGVDILSSSRVLDSTSIKTALYGLGASGENDGPRLDFSKVVWSKANGDPTDKPLGQQWVGDDAALQKWGYQHGKQLRHKFGYYDGQEEDAAELLLATWNELQRLKTLNETYDINIVVLGETIGKEYKKVRLGDSCFVINRRIHPAIEIEVSIIEFRHNLNDRRQSEVTLGDFRNVFDLAAVVNSTASDLNDKRGNWDKKPTTGEVEQIAGGAAADAAQQALFEANIALANARTEIDASIAAIGQGGIDLATASALIQDTIAQPQNYKGQMVGDIVADSIIVRGPVTAMNIAITGTILGDTLTVMNASIRKGTIIDATIQNATITGRLVGVTGTFTGDITSGSTITGAKITSRYVTPGGPINVASMTDGSISISELDASGTWTTRSAFMEAGYIELYDRGNGTTTTISGIDVRTTGRMVANLMYTTVLEYPGNVYSGEHLYIRPKYSYSEVRITASQSTSTYAVLRAGKLISQGTAEIAGRAYLTGGLTVGGGSGQYVYTNAVENNVTGLHLYMRTFSGGEVRATVNGSTSTYTAVRAQEFYSEDGFTTRGTGRLISSPGGTMYLQNGYEVAVTNKNTGSYTPVRASSFPTGSRVEFKTDIQKWEESALDLINNTTIYDYMLKEDLNQGRIKRRQGVIIGEGYDAPAGVIDGDGVEQYAMNSWSWKAIQELSQKIKGIEDMVNDLKLQQDFSGMRLKNLEAAAGLIDSTKGTIAGITSAIKKDSKE